MTSGSPPGGNGIPPSDRPVLGSTQEDRLDIPELLRAVRRNAWIVALCMALGLFVGWFLTRNERADYTAEVLFQRRADPAQMAMLGGARAELAPTVSAEMIVLESRAVLGPVVDSLALRLVIEEPIPRSRLFDEVRIGPEAVPGRYELARDDGTVRLRTATGSVVGRAAPGEWLRAPGIEFLLLPTFDLEDVVELTVLGRERAVERLRSGIDLQQVGQTPIIRARYTDPDPVVAAAVVEWLTRSYQEHATRRAATEAVRRREFLASLLSSAEDSLLVAQEAILRYQERSGSASPEAETAALRGMIMDAEEELRSVRTSEEILRTLNESLRSGAVDDEALRRTLILGRGIVPNIEQLYNDLMGLRAERTRLTASRFGLTEQGTQVQVVDSLIAEKRTELQAIVQQSLESLPDRRQILNDQIENLRSLLSSLPEESAVLGRLQQRLDRVAGTYQLLADRYYEAQIAAAVEAGDVEVVDPPVIPSVPNPSRGLRILLLGAGLGALFGGVIAFGVDRLDTRVRDDEDAERVSGLQVLGAIPLVPMLSEADGAARPLMVDHGTPEGEAFRKVRTMLRFVRVERPRLVSVTSPGPGEGKSVVAANTAIAFAREGMKVILVDADMRRPTVHLSFGIDPHKPGLSDLLVSEVEVERAIRHDPENRLDLIPAGTLAPNPAELLGGAGFSSLLRELRLAYDLVVIDTPPVLAVADPTLIGPQIEGVIVVARMDHTDRRALGQATEQLRRVGAPLLGLVLNAVPEAGRYGYGYRYSSYYTEENGGGTGSGGRIRRWLTAARS